MTFILCTAVGAEIYEGKPARCESQNGELQNHEHMIQGGCSEISGVLPKDDIKCITGPYGIRIGKTGIQTMMVEVGGWV